MEKHTQEISEVKMNLDKEKQKYVKLEEYVTKISKLKKELETEKDKSLNMDELKKNLESKKITKHINEIISQNKIW